MAKKGLLNYAVLLLGLAIVVLAAIMYFVKESNYSNYNSKTRGDVATYLGKIGSKVPVIKYKVANKEYRLIDSSHIVSSMQNKSVTIFYNSYNPQEAKIYDNFQVWGIPLSIFIIGVFFIIFGYIILKSKN